MPNRSDLIVHVADRHDREQIYAIRHEVYARELQQHHCNQSGRLIDALDDHNVYLCVMHSEQIVGFISITPPGGPLSIDKYFSRADLPIVFDDTLYEVRLLTVLPQRRGRIVALLLMFAAMRWIEERGGQRIVAIGRAEVLELYRKVGLQPLGYRVQSGAVTFELMSAEISKLRQHNAPLEHVYRRAVEQVNWKLDVAPNPASRKPADCFHGGAFFDSIGADFRDLSRRNAIVNADVLDAWFPPSPRVLDAMKSHLDWLARTSPPTDCGGLIDAIADARDVDRSCIVPGGGSSDLIFRALRQWLTSNSRVLILDPMYGEYAHVLERVIGCRVNRLTLCRANNYDLDPSELVEKLRERYDLCVLVNPNSPTGRHVDSSALRDVLQRSKQFVGRFWIDETYIDYVGGIDRSLERFASTSENVFICKSMSKMYALSGMRAAYLVGNKTEIAKLCGITPPWVVGLPAQLAGVVALRDPSYYAMMYTRTHELRRSLQSQLIPLGLETIDGVANFVLAFLREDQPDAETVVQLCRRDGVFIRNADGMGKSLGDRAIRIAVKSESEQKRIIESLTRALHPRSSPQPDRFATVQPTSLCP